MSEDWLVKDFDVLYRAALDVSESIVEPEKESPPQRYLRAQLARLRPALEMIQVMKRESVRDASVVRFEVEAIDQVNEGRAVWVIEEDCIDMRETAEMAAKERSEKTNYRWARVVRVTREVVAVYWRGNKR